MQKDAVVLKFIPHTTQMICQTRIVTTTRQHLYHGNRTNLLITSLALFSQAASKQRTKTVTLACPEEYSLVGSSCYMVTEERVAGSAAGAACRRAGGAAAVIDSQEEMDALRGA